ARIRRAFYIVSERVASWRKMIPVTSERIPLGTDTTPLGLTGDQDDRQTQGCYQLRGWTTQAL
ncbi:MAG: hypothetical protein ACE5JX_10930, partial [Acidobacteriota bacterium]